MRAEAVGVIASLFVLFSFCFKEEKTIRLVNILGAGLYVLYGVLINAFSVYFLNGALIVIHLFRLIKK